MENITEKEKRKMNIEDDGETEAHHGQTVTAPKIYFDIFASISSFPFRIVRLSGPVPAQCFTFAARLGGARRLDVARRGRFFGFSFTHFTVYFSFRE